MGMAKTTCTRTIRNDQVVPGMIIDFLGTPHLIAEIEPYIHPTMGEMVGIARAADGWGITLSPGESTTISTIPSVS